MAAIPEEALQGEWFYLEEEQPLDRSTPDFFILEGGRVRSSTKADLHGTYFIADNTAVLAFAPRDRCEFVLKLAAAGDIFDERTPSLQAGASYLMTDFDEPAYFYGTFVRRFADFFCSADVEMRIR